MLIKVRTKKLALTIPVPNWLLLNPFCTSYVLRRVNQEQVSVPVISSHQMQAFGRLIHDIKRTHGSLTLLEVEAADGTYVEIRL